MTNVVGRIIFGTLCLDVYNSLESPLFRASDVGEAIGYSDGNVWALTNDCEEDEKLVLPTLVAGQTRKVTFITESGLYNILEQSRKPIARKWRKIINNELIRLRKSRSKDVVEQFDDWNHELDNLYFDERTGQLMCSVTVEGGDVEQVPYEEIVKGEDNGSIQN